MIVIIPSIILSIFAYRLGSILEFSGIFSLMLSGVVIPIAALATQQLIVNKSEYDFFDNYIAAIGLLLLSAVIIVGCLVFFIIEFI